MFAAMASSLLRLNAIHLLFAYLLFLEAVSADPPYMNCPNSTDIEPSPMFKKNLKILLDSLSSNASVVKFHTSSTGSNNDSVYGLYMCYGYLSIPDCRNCIATASQNLLSRCPTSLKAMVWEDNCQARYSNGEFFGQLDVSSNMKKDNVENISEPQLFNDKVRGLLGNLTEHAAFNVSLNMFATGETPFLEKTLYSLVQCTTDLSAESCEKCLQRAMADVFECCNSSIGARILSPSCYLRYELYSFYGAPSNTTNPSTPPGSSPRKLWRIVIIVLAISACLGGALVGFSAYILAIRKRRKDRNLGSIDDPTPTEIQIQKLEGIYKSKDQEFPFMDFASLSTATDNFSESNKLGEGGFGPVYKGRLDDGKEVAVKRLSNCSGQGAREFINEVMLIIKLQHKNLVRLLGFCAYGDEKLLVYEYMPNSSLDVFLFDSLKRAKLDWNTRLNIISGIARGVLYLHEDSRLKIIHRDLKASNVLLDQDMNPKISDFGMARIFAGCEADANTATVVGTYGYMAPEYAMDGLYSIKSDVFSFGILLLEIITGQKSTGFHRTKIASSLQAYVWRIWNDGRWTDLVDPAAGWCSRDEVVRHVHIGLLCTQEDPSERPTVSTVVMMLGSGGMLLPQPGRPALLMGRYSSRKEDEINSDQTVNDLTISDLHPR